MTDLLLIISKAHFEAEHRNAKEGDALAFKKYGSTHATIEQVKGGGSLFLVTVRPPDERLWLVGELVNPTHDGHDWKAPPSDLTVRDITALIPKFTFSNGKGLAPKKGALGMSLQTPRVLTAEDVAMLRGGAAVAAQPKRTTAVKPRAVGSPRELLETAVSAATLAEAIEPLRQYWEVTRVPLAADLLGAIGDLVQRDQPDFNEGSREKQRSDWMDAAKKNDSRLFTPLLFSLTHVSMADAELRMEVVAKWPPDPRVAERLFEYTGDLSIGGRPIFWRHTWDLMTRNADPRFSKELEARAQKLERSRPFDRVKAEKPHALRNIGPYLEAAGKGRAATVDEVELLEALKKKVSGADAKEAAKNKSGDELALLRAIGGAWEDDTPKAIYADFLAERGDAQADSINAVLKLEKGQKLTAKLEALTKKRKKSSEISVWHMERGFPVEVNVPYEKLSPATLAKIVKSMEWVTVRKLDLRGEAADHPWVNAVLSQAPLYSLRELTMTPGKALSVISARDFPWAIERIELFDDEVGDDVTIDSFPTLRELNVDASGDHPAFWKSKFINEVKHFTAGGESRGGTLPIAELLTHLPTLKSFESFSGRTSGTTMTATRSKPGQVEVVLTLSDWFDGESKNAARVETIPSENISSFKLVIDKGAKGVDAFKARIAHLL